MDEGIPLSRTSSSLASRAESSVMEMEQEDIVSTSSYNNNKISTISQPLGQLFSFSFPKSFYLQTVASLCFGYAGLKFPKILIRRAMPSILQKSVPFQTTQAGDVILDPMLNQPLMDPPTIPSWILIWTSIYIPFLIVVLGALLWKQQQSSSSRVVRKWHDVHAALCGFACTIGLSEATTHILKLYVQRRRPNFYALCGFDPVVARACTASPDHIVEANFSFPSGHSSLACCAMTFLVWFFVGKILGPTTSSWNNKATKRVWCFGVAYIGWGWAIFVGASRLADRWHHPSDVVAGLILGFWISTIMYHAWYSPVWSVSPPPGTPWSYTNPGGLESKLPSFHE